MSSCFTEELIDSKIFGEDDEEGDAAELDKAQASGENGTLPSSRRPVADQ